MARFLFTVWSFSGHLNPNIAVANVLRTRGHDVAFYTGARAASTLASLEIPHFPVRCIAEDRLYGLVFPPDESAGRANTLAGLRHLQATLRAWMLGTTAGQVSDLEPVLRDWQPDVIVCDPTMWAPFLILHERDTIPVAILSYTTGCMIGDAAVPPWGRGLPPPTTLARRARVLVESALAGRATASFRAAANDLRRAHGLPALTTSVTDFAGTMPLYLVTSVPELDYKRRSLPPAVRYVGRCAWDRPSDQPPPAWIDDLPRDRPLVYVTEGTGHGPRPRLLRAAARGLAGLPVQALLSINAGCDLVAAGLSAPAPNVRLEPFTPGRGWQGDILPRASVMVTNGGAGSVQAALAEGVPQLVVPTVWDKPENAQRVVEAGAGLRLSPRRLTPERLRHAVERILSEPSFRANARRIAAALGRMDGPSCAAESLETLSARAGGMPAPALARSP